MRLFIIALYLSILSIFLLFQNVGAVIINEALPDPAGKDSEGEFIELYNPDNFSVDIFAWKLKDEIGQGRTFIFNDRTNDRTLLKPLQFLVCPISQTGIALNNTGDTILLIDQGDQIVSALSFGRAESGLSYSKTATGFAWTKPTPGTKNEEAIKTVATSTSSVTQNATKETKTKNSFVLSVSIAAFSGILAVLTKKRLIFK